jgi:hypothetical protein
MYKTSMDEIDTYIKEAMSASVDILDVLDAKISIHRDFIYLEKDNEITKENKYLYDEIKIILDGIRKIKGITPLGLIRRKIELLSSQIEFNKLLGR